MTTVVVTPDAPRAELLSVPPVVERLVTETFAPAVVETPSLRGEVTVAASPAREVLLHDMPPQAVELVVQGPQGPQGEPGPQGPPGEQVTTVIAQVEPADTWVLHHRLGRHPSVTVIDSAGTVVLGGVRYVDADTIELTFSASFAGTAYLN